MKRKILLLLLLAFSLQSFGQTFTGDVSLGNQAEVIAFGANNYITVDGSVTIGGTVTDLTPINSLQNITKELIIGMCTSLTNLNGLNNLTDIGSFNNDYEISLIIDDNPSLGDITALQNLTQIEGFIIHDNTSLTSLEGLHNIITMNSFFSLQGNSSLTDLNGLRGLNGAHVLQVMSIDSNDNLISLNGLQNFAAEVEAFEIRGNPELRSLAALSSFTSVLNGTTTISDNTKLTSFCGAFGLSSGSMSVSENAQNPTQQEINNAGPCVYTSIPDNNFEAYLIAQNIDTEQIVDNRVLTSDISALTNLDIESQSISDLTGIQDFAALQTLNANFNSISAIDIAQNSNLEIIQLLQNSLSTIDLTMNTQLIELRVDSNNLSSVDLSQNTNLEILNLGGNTVNTINLSSNILLKEIYLGDNNLSALNLSTNNNLEILAIFSNSLSNLNLSNKPEINLVIASSNNLSAIDLTNTPKLNTAILDANNLTSLDVSLNSALGTLRINNNNLTSLNAKSDALLNLSANQNPNLNCIEVKDVTQAEQNVTNGDWIVDPKPNLFSTDCAGAFTAIPDDNFEQALIDLGIDTNPTLDNQVLTSAIEAVTFLNLTGDPNLNFNQGEIGLNILSLEGIKAFTSLETLWAQGNQLTELDLENMTTLTDVRGFFNQLTSVNFNGLNNLEIIGLNGNQISTIDLSANTGLLQFDIALNTLTSLDIRNNTLLNSMDIRSNPNLTCVLVTDVAAANSNGGFNKDSGTIYSLDCNATVTAEFSQALGEDFEANGGNLPKLLVTGTITNATTITVQDITTDVNVIVGEDYTFNNPTVINIPIGIYDGTLNTAIDIPGLAILDDVDFESRAELNFQLNGFTGDITGLGGVVTTTYNISNDDYTAVVAATDLIASEDGLEEASFAILLDGTVDSGVTVNVNYTITGSATNAVDYKELSGSVQILEGTNDATITIIPRQDPDVEGTEDLIITLSGGALYRIGNPSEASIEILDNDVAGTPNFILSKNIVTTSEPNSTDSFTVVLNQQPATDVVIDIVSDNVGEATTDLTSLTFSNANWNTPQTVTVSGQDDVVVDGTQNYVLTLSVNDAASDDVFDLVENQTVNGTNTDDDVAGTHGFTLSKNTVTTMEPNGSDSFTVVLDEQPATDVVIDIISNDLGEAIVTPVSLTFSNANWNIPQTVTVTGQDDAVVDGTQNYVLTLSINDAASDDIYDPIPDQNVNGTNTDDDVTGAPGFTLSKNIVATAEPNDSDSFTVVLNEQPATNVVIDIVSNDTDEATVDPASLIFSNTNWNTPQTVTVTGQDDQVVDGTQNYTLTLSINDAASDDAYDALADQTVTGANSDNDIDNSMPNIGQEDLKVVVQNATCKDINNGEIRIEVLANYTFNVALNDINQSETVTPGSNLILGNLAKGPYTICLTIAEFPNWQQCFTSTITNFEDLAAGILNVDSAEQSAVISLQGSTSYKVNVNDKAYNYDFNDISLKTLKIPLELGMNKVTIRGHSDCQGIFNDEITIGDVKYYPNPVITEVNIDGLPINEVLQFKIFNSTGKLVVGDSKETPNGKIKIDLESLSAGWYFMKLVTKTEVLEYKIIKK